MTQPQPLIPRKRPRQARAIATVEAVLDAAAHILTKEGYDAATTNRIAEVAGVSIGSLYQYFPNRDVLFAALKARHTREILSILERHVGGAGPRSLRRSLSILIEAFVEAHETNAGLHDILETSLSHIDSSGIDGELDDAFFCETRRFLELHRRDIRRKDLELTTRMVMAATESVVHDVILRQPAGAQRDAAKEELVVLLLTYLLAEMVRS